MSPLDADPITQVVAGTVVTGGVLMAMRKIWRSFSNEHVETRRDGAEIALLNNLRAEITRMGEDISRLKSTHAEEIQDLRESNNSRMGELESQVEGLEQAMTTMKQAAMDAYTTMADEPAIPTVTKTAISGYLRTIMQTTIPNSVYAPATKDTSPSGLTRRATDHKD